MTFNIKDNSIHSKSLEKECIDCSFNINNWNADIEINNISNNNFANISYDNQKHISFNYEDNTKFENYDKIDNGEISKRLKNRKTIDKIIHILDSSLYTNFKNKNEENEEKSILEDLKNIRKKKSIAFLKNKRKSRKISTQSDQNNKFFGKTVLNQIENNEDILEIKYKDLKEDVLSYIVYEKLFKNNYVYSPENNEYFLTSDEQNLRNIHILAEENLKNTQKNYIICLIPFDKISNINLEFFYNSEKVELNQKIKEHINNNTEDLENIYNFNVENLIKDNNLIKNSIFDNLKDFLNIEKGPSIDWNNEKNPPKDEFNNLVIENEIKNLSIFGRSVSERKGSCIPSPPKTKMNNSIFYNNHNKKNPSIFLENLSDKKISSNNPNQNSQENSNYKFFNNDDSEIICSKSKNYVMENIIKIPPNSKYNSKSNDLNKDNNELTNYISKFGDITNFIRDYFHPKILFSREFLKSTKKNFNGIQKNNLDVKAKNITNTHLLYSNVSEEFPFEFILCRKYKINKKISEIRIIERENLIIENFEKFKRDLALPKNLK